jgi:hypothetical protein
MHSLICAGATGCFLVLVVAHGVHDAFHEDEAGAIVCVALTLGLAGVRLAPSRLTEPFAVLVVVAIPPISAPVTKVERQPRGSPLRGSLRLRL